MCQHQDMVSSFKVNINNNKIQNTNLLWTWPIWKISLTSIYVYIDTHICICVCLYVYICVCVYILRYIYIYMKKYVPLKIQNNHSGSIVKLLCQIGLRIFFIWYYPKKGSIHWILIYENKYINQKLKPIFYALKREGINPQRSKKSSLPLPLGPLGWSNPNHY